MNAGAWSSTGAPVAPSWKANPLSVMASTSTSTGLVNFRTMARSSRSIVHRLNTRPSAISSWVTAVCSTLTPSSFGSNDTCVTQFRVIMLRVDAAAGPAAEDVQPVGQRPQHPAPELVVLLLGGRVVADPGRERLDGSGSTWCAIPAHY